MEERLLDLAAGQRKTLLRLAKRLLPKLVEEDLLQPNDFPELENHPEFRYEEGVLHGIEAALAALRSRQ